MARSKWWRPDPGTLSGPLVQRRDGVLLEACVVAICQTEVQLAVEPNGGHPVLARFTLDFGMPVDVPSSADGHLTLDWMDAIRKVATGQICGNCGRAHKCLRLVCDGWKPMGRAERKRRALKGPLEELDPDWSDWRGGEVRPGLEKRRVHVTYAAVWQAVPAGTDLQPCPFCHGRGALHEETCAQTGRITYAVRCLGCAAAGPWEKTSTGAENGWNGKWTSTSRGRKD